jgi:hypothetical protein
MSVLGAVQRAQASKPQLHTSCLRVPQLPLPKQTILRQTLALELQH